METNYNDRMGFVFSGMNLGLLVSPFLGGLIYDKLGYYAVFYASFSVTAFAFLWRLATIERDTAAKWLGVDRLEDTPVTGHVAHAATDRFSECSTSIDEQWRQAQEPTESTALLGDGQKKPASKFARNYSTMAILLGSPRLQAAVYGSFTLFVITTAFDGILPLFVIRTFSWSSTGAGLIFLAMTSPSVFGVVYGSLSDLFGPRKVSLAGFVMTTLSLAMLSLTARNNFFSQVLLCVLLAFIGWSPPVLRVNQKKT